MAIARQVMHAPCIGCGRYARGHELCWACIARLNQTPWGVGGIALSDVRIPVLWRESYGGPLTDIIVRAKYRGQWSAAKLLGRCLGGLPPPWLGMAPIAVPVPLTGKRLAERGFSQSHLIAAQAARQWRIECHGHWLAKQRHTLRQASLAADERRTNLQGSLTGAAQLAGKRVLLIDDIMTSGATLKEAMRAISEAGGTVIAAAVVAKVNDQRPRRTDVNVRKTHYVQHRSR